MFFEAKIYPKLIDASRKPKRLLPVSMTEEGELVRLKFPFNRYLLNEIKSMEGARWDPDNGKTWTIKNSERNWFQLAFLAGEKPYSWYDRPLVPVVSERPWYSHQLDMTSHILTYHYAIEAAEMGTGKSGASIEAMEQSGSRDWIYIGPRSAIASYELELRKWKSRIYPEIYTYDGLRKLVAEWPRGKVAPRGVIFDESSRLKNPTSQRSQAAYHLAKAIRAEHGDDGYVVLMSGSPAPKSPADWWWQCEIACPGYIREGTIAKFKARLGLIVEKKSITGGVYPHLVTWLDDERKCKKCGQLAEHEDHRPPDAFSAACGSSEHCHEFVPSVNEISYLYERMKGLVLVKFKKDCLKDLPDKRYRVIECTPSQETLNAAQIIVGSASTTISGITLLRELSDGFQYVSTDMGQVKCQSCQGACVVERPVPIVEQEELDAAMSALAARAEEEGWPSDEDGCPLPEHIILADKYELQMVPCYGCGGQGTVTRYNTEAVQVPCPKEDALKDILDSHEEDGRLVVYAGFQGSIDRVIQVCNKMNWEWIKADGRGWNCSAGLMTGKAVDMLDTFQHKQAKHPRVVFIGQPGAAGMGLTLTAACEIVYWSNDFNAESRIQSEDRIHRMGMDLNKGALITDLIHLPSDMLVLENLRKKKDLQALSMGNFEKAFQNLEAGGERRL